MDEENLITIVGPKKRQPKTGGYTQISVSLPNDQLEMLDRVARQQSKSRAQIIVYLIWQGYFSTVGKDKPL
jgi:hypothetical protein